MTDELVEDLLKCLGQFKITVEFKGKDFNADEPRQYEEDRGLMVKINESYTTLFGSTDIPNIQTDADEDKMEIKEKERRTGSQKIKQGYKRIMEKLKR